ncbi:hypothetical protein [Salegentibacter maritimus]|uniref:Uncharacterized protein n=1 Tax=Salegentibacter maritimus TaxID=2794347 RepID=A0ABS0TM08_9FLAO|nr:hypothetical protein [Salegentibacter maritimus]MBI6121059.1 hypothetical protein [Salegentibacter maritimus]
MKNQSFKLKNINFIVLVYKLNSNVRLGKVYLPTWLSYDPETNMISLDMPEIYTPDYFKNVFYSLQLAFSGSRVTIMYYGENDTYLSQVLYFEDWDIAGGDLELESFGKIQERALRALGNYFPDLNREVYDLFNEE